MGFSEFIYEQGIIGITIGTITAFAISNLIKDVNHEVIRKVLAYMKVSNAGIVSSIFEFLILMFIVYLLYAFILLPIFKRHIEDEKKETASHKDWKQDLLYEVKTMDMGSVYMK